VAKINLIILTSLILLSLTGCGARKVSTEKTTDHNPSNTTNPTNTTNPSNTTNRTENSKYLEAKAIQSQFSATADSTEELPSSVVTDLTIQGNQTVKYSGYTTTSTAKTLPKGFEDGAGSSALNLSNDLLRSSPPKDASTKVSDPSIPTAIPTMEVSSPQMNYIPSNVKKDYRPSQPGTAKIDYRPSQTGTARNDYNQPQPAMYGSNNASSNRTYKVEKGDTLYGISRKFNVTVGQIISANDSLNNPNELHVGQTLNLP